MTNDPSMIKQYMEEVIPRLESADYVDRYVWFASRFATQVRLYFLLSHINNIYEGLGTKLAAFFRKLSSIASCFSEVNIRRLVHVIID